MISADQRRAWSNRPIDRLAVGIENAEDLIADLEHALTVVARTRQHAQVV